MTTDPARLAAQRILELDDPAACTQMEYETEVAALATIIREAYAAQPKCGTCLGSGYLPSSPESGATCHTCHGTGAQPAPNVEERATEAAGELSTMAIRDQSPANMAGVIARHFRDLEPNARLRAAAQELVDYVLGLRGGVEAEYIIRGLRAALDAAPDGGNDER